MANIKDKLNLKEDITPRVAAVHDLCGYGNCSLAIALPVVSAAGVDTLPVPTSILSNHTGYPFYSFLDTSETLDEYIENWKKLEVELDGIYTGFLGSVEQIGLIKKLHSYYPNSLTVIDPVMGDNGVRYSSYTDEMCAGMRELVEIADVLTPNITEASILLDEEYPGINISIDEARVIAQKLIDMGASNVVLKGIENEDEVINVLLTEDGDFHEIRNELYPEKLHGTGDLFASCITAGLFSGHDLLESTEFAAGLVLDAVKFSTKQPGFRERGVSFEPLIYDIAKFARD